SRRNGSDENVGTGLVPLRGGVRVHGSASDHTNDAYGDDQPVLPQSTQMWRNGMSLVAGNAHSLHDTPNSPRTSARTGWRCLAVRRKVLRARQLRLEKGHR